MFHLVGDNPAEVSADWKLIRSGTIVLLPVTYIDLPRFAEFTYKYQNRPMDYADATLVLLAERESLTTIFTIDNNDFETYLIQGKKRLTIVSGHL
ncbi:MAG: hypothetical protein V3U76_02915 [Granulosicoccus sp.]